MKKVCNCYSTLLLKPQIQKAEAEIASILLIYKKHVNCIYVAIDFIFLIIGCCWLKATSTCSHKHYFGRFRIQIRKKIFTISIFLLWKHSWREAGNLPPFLGVFKTALNKAVTEPVWFSQQSCSMQEKQMNFCLTVVQNRPCTERNSNQCFYDFTKQLKLHSTTYNKHRICFTLSNSHCNLSNSVHLKVDFGIKKNPWYG